MSVLFIINDAPYGNERMYNALRLAIQLQKTAPGIEIRVFLMADAVSAALPGQDTPNGYYNIGRMLTLLLNHDAQIKLCGSCLQARGIADLSLINKVEISNMPALAEWTVSSDKVLVF